LVCISPIQNHPQFISLQQGLDRCIYNFALARRTRAISKILCFRFAISHCPKVEGTMSAAENVN